MWQTWLKQPRNVKRFAVPISFKLSEVDVPSQEAVQPFGEHILLEDIVVALHADGTVSERTHLVTMLVGDESLSRWDKPQFHMLDHRGKWSVEHSKLYNPEGKVKRIRPQRDRFPHSDGRRMRPSTLLTLNYKPLKPGVIVDEATQNDHWVAGELGPHLYRDFFMQTPAPCDHRRITVAVSQKHTLRFGLHGGMPEPETSEVAGYRVYQWEQRGCPGVSPEPMTPPLPDFAPWVQLTTLPDWKATLDKHRKELDGKGKDRDVPKLAREIFDGLSSQEAKARAAYRYCNLDVRYGRHPDEMANRETRASSEVVGELRGDCKDKTRLLKGLLSEAGIESRRVLVASTDRSGTTGSLPPGFFDHVVLCAKVDEQEVWMDPAAKFTQYGELPDSAYRATSLDIDSTNSSCSRIPDLMPEQNGYRRVMKGEIHTDGRLVCKAECELLGLMGTVARLAIESDPKQTPEAIISQQIVRSRPGYTVDSIKVQNPDDLNGPLKYKYRFTRTDLIRPVHNLYLLKAFWTHSLFHENLALPPTRSNPGSGLRPERAVNQIRLRLPDGYTLSEPLPRFEDDCGFALYRIDTRLDGRELVVDIEFEACAGMIPVAEYDRFREHIMLCVKADEIEFTLIPEE